MDIDRSPDGLYFYLNNFWSILQDESYDPELPPEVVREDVAGRSSSVPQISPMDTVRKFKLEEASYSVAGASGLLPSLAFNTPIEPNTVYLMPPPQHIVFHSREVLEKA